MIAAAGQFQAASGRALVLAQQRLVALAKSKNAEIMARDPRPSGFVRFVDGRRGAAEEAVKAAGVIVYVYERLQVGFDQYLDLTRVRLDDIARFALETLRSISPIGQGGDPHPGQYRAAHALFLNGYPVKNLSHWNPGDEISISNFVEYSRILEIGDGKFRVPMNIYERAFDIIDEKYGRDAELEFTWRGIVNDLQIPQGSHERRGFGVRVTASTRQHNKAVKRFPTIVLKPFAEKSLTGAYNVGQAIDFASNVLTVADAVRAIASAGQPSQPQITSRV